AAATGLAEGHAHPHEPNLMLIHDIAPRAVEVTARFQSNPSAARPPICESSSDIDGVDVIAEPVHPLHSGITPANEWHRTRLDWRSAVDGGGERHRHHVRQAPDLASDAEPRQI